MLLKIIIPLTILLSCISVSPLDKDESMATASLYEQQGKYHEAEHILLQLRSKYPRDLSIAYKLGCFYSAIGNVTQALEVFKTILTIAPENNVQTLYNIGYVLKSASMVDEAINWYTKALELDPQYEPAIFALGIAYLYKGDFDKGWKVHEQHLKKTNKNADQLRNFLHNNTIQGKIILLRPDGGMGDVIQFIRYAQILKERGARVLAAVQKPLVPLLSRCPFLDQVTSMHDPLPLCHDWCPVMSLPAIFHSDEKTIPRNIPYIFSAPERSTYWKEYINNQEKKVNIGICWQADVHNDSSRPAFARRGMPLKQFTHISTIPGIQLYSLQQKEGLDQIADFTTHNSLITFDETFDKDHGPFMDTAALMQHLDLIITVDTAIAHLAGALGARVWLLLPYCTDWRWIVGRVDSCWYPTMKIFKQKKPFDWDGVMNEVERELEKIINE